MQIVEHAYVQERDGNLYVGDTRVAVRSIVAEWLQGLSAEEIDDLLLIATCSTHQEWQDRQVYLPL